MQKVDNRIISEMLRSKVLIVFNDGKSVATRIGRILAVDEHFIYIWSERSRSYEAIALHSIIRMEFFNSKR